MTEYTFQRKDADLTALAALTGTGILARTAAATYSTRTLTGTTNEITVTNGDGVSGNPTLSIPDAVTLVTLTLTNDLTVANGGTGAGTFTDGGVLLGSGTGALTAMAALADGAIIVGDGVTDPVALTAFTSSTGTLKHEQGGLEFDVSAITTNEFIGGTSSGVMAIRSAAQVRTSLGLVIGTNVQAWDAQLDDIAALAVTNGNIIVGDDSNWVAESGATARTSLGVAIGSDVQAHGDVLDDLNTTGIVGADSEFLVGTASGAMAWEDAATAATSMGLGTGDDVDFTSVSVKGQKIQSFILKIVNTGGTIQHSIMSDVASGGASNFADKVLSADNNLQNTTTISSSVAITNGMGILNGSLEVITFDTAAQIVADFIGVVSVEQNTTTTDVTAIIGFASRNIDSVTRVRLQMALYDTATGASFTVDTSNFASGKALIIRFTGYMA